MKTTKLLTLKDWSKFGDIWILRTPFNAQYDSQPIARSFKGVARRKSVRHGAVGRTLRASIHFIFLYRPKKTPQLNGDDFAAGKDQLFFIFFSFYYFSKMLLTSSRFRKMRVYKNIKTCYAR
jgi:hypothetical protein